MSLLLYITEALSKSIEAKKLLNPQALSPLPRGVPDMAYSGLIRLRVLGLFACAFGVFPVPFSAESQDRGAAPQPSAALRAETSFRGGFKSALELSSGAARLTVRLTADPGDAPEAKAGTSGPLWVAGPVRHSGTARVLADPCADAYLFTGSWTRPLVLDFDSRYYGVFAGGSAGAWFQGASAPRMGIWAGTEEKRGFEIGAAAAVSLQPASGGFDSWFEEKPPVPERLLAAGVVWAGYEFPAGGMIAAAAVSEEDRGGRGWAFRAEGDYESRRFRANGRVSGASAGWRGLGGNRADRWEVRTDASWLIQRRLRLDGRLRLGQDPEESPNWETLIRVFQDGGVWRWGAELGGCDSSRDLPVRLDPAVWAAREGKAVRTTVRVSWVAEGADLTRTEISASLVLGSSIRPDLRLEGARRWTTEGFYWKAASVLEIPGPRGAWTARAGTGTWVQDGASVPWELAFALRYRLP